MNTNGYYIAYRSIKRVGILAVILIAAALTMIFVDLSFLVPDETLTTFRNQGRRTFLQSLLTIFPWIGGIVLVILGVSLPFLLRKKVEVEVSEDGIFYPSGLEEPLPWDRIENIAHSRIGLFPILSVKIHEGQNFPIKPIARKIAELNSVSGLSGDLNIDISRSDGSIDELIEAIAQHHQVHGAH